MIRSASLLLVVSLAMPLTAATFSVNTTTDGADLSPGDGLCAITGGNCSLRAAVQEANASIGADTIGLPAGTYSLSIAGAGEDNAATGDLDVRGTLTIAGAGTATTTISGAGLDRVFDLFAGLSLSGVTVRQGNAGAGNGGALRVGTLAGQTFINIIDVVFTANTAANGGALATGGGTQTLLDIRRARFEANSAAVLGGAIYSNGGRLTWYRVQTSRFAANSAVAGGGAVYVNDAAHQVLLVQNTFEDNTTPGNGGAIYADGFNSEVDLDQSTLTRNSAANGGAIYTCCTNGAVQPTGLDTLFFVLVNSTLSANSATVAGGAVYSTSDFGSSHSTLVGNAAPASAGVHNGSFNTALLMNSVLANSGANCGGGTFDGAYTVLNDSSCTGLTVAEHNLPNTDPLLGPLADNGGPTLTHHPLPGSPAIDLVPPAELVATVDQRGVARPAGAGADAGSVEVSTVPPAATSITLSASPNPAVAGDPITLTAVVPNVATGVVTFRSGSTILGQRDLTSISPAILILPSLPPGTYTITATFEGTPALQPSTSAPLTLFVVSGAAQLAAIPSLGELGLATLALLMAMAGVLVMRR
jgi:CSLREA domain-containing protein